MSTIRSVSVRGPVDVGEKLTVIEQLEPELNVVPQVLDEMEKCVPVARETEEMDSVPEFVFERTTACLAEPLLTA